MLKLWRKALGMAALGRGALGDLQLKVGAGSRLEGVVKAGSLSRGKAVGRRRACEAMEKAAGKEYRPA